MARPREFDPDDVVDGRCASSGARGYSETSVHDLVEDLLTPAGRVGCLMVNSTVELAAEDSVIAGVTGEHMRRLERHARRALANARRAGEVRAGLDPEAKATALMAMGMGLMVVGKTSPGREVLKTIVDAGRHPRGLRHRLGRAPRQSRPRAGPPGTDARRDVVGRPGGGEPRGRPWRDGRRHHPRGRPRPPCRRSSPRSSAAPSTPRPRASSRSTRSPTRTGSWMPAGPAASSSSPSRNDPPPPRCVFPRTPDKEIR
jgi:hypothetical protein